MIGWNNEMIQNILVDRRWYLMNRKKIKEEKMFMADRRRFSSEKKKRQYRNLEIEWNRTEPARKRKEEFAAEHG